MSVTVEVRGFAALVTMRWADKRNALGPSEAREITAAVDRAAEQALAAVVLTGEGAFCSGGDLRTFADISARHSVTDIRDHVYADMQGILRALAACPVPTIAAVDGPAIGLGFDLALACDMRFVGPSGWLQQGWAMAGLINATGGIALMNALNPAAVWRVIAEQPRLDRETASDLGLAERADGTAVDSAIARAQQLSAIPRDVLTHYCELDRGCRWPDPSHFDRAAAIQAELIGSPRFRELAEARLNRAAAR
jgi:enoyl-CoA hydratase/carnithine racemase